MAASEDACYQGHCSIEVDHHVYMDQACSIDTGDFGLSFHSRSKYFAYVISADDEGHYRSTWNGVEAESHAMDDLGIVNQVGDCWVGTNSKICVSKKEQIKCNDK
jgi:hypothetical protein